MQECPSHAGAHPPLRKWLRPFWAMWNLSERAPDTLRSLGYDLVFFQREMLSTFVTWEPLTRRPRVLDVDDAIWVHQRGEFARRLAGLCEHVICGNRFLAEQFAHWNPNISILPTPVDVHRFHPSTMRIPTDRPVIGWMGLSKNLVFLYQIEEALYEVLRRHPRAVLRVVTGEAPKFHRLPSDQVEYIPWTPDNEASTMQDMTIGIMPLEDSLFERGKCSYKMLLYMSSALPVVVSPVGMNAEVLAKGKLGFAAQSQAQWIEYLDLLIRDADLRLRMGNTGREVVVQNYSVEVLAPQLAKTLCSVAGNQTRRNSVTATSFPSRK